MMVEFYIKNYAQNAEIPPEEFGLWEKRAVCEINRITAHRELDYSSENLKMCICDIAEELYKQKQRGGIESENNDGYSVKFKNSDGENAIWHIAKRWLSGTGLLYRGDICDC